VPFYIFTRNVWFTDAANVLAAARTEVSGQDDCGGVTFSPPILNAKCQFSTVLLSAADRCGNRANTTVGVLFDDQPPQIAFSLAPLTSAANIFTLDPLVFEGEAVKRDRRLSREKR